MSSNNSEPLTGIGITAIVFIILTVGLGIGEYFTAKTLSETKNKIKSFEKQSQEISSQNSRLDNQAGELKKKIGTQVEEFAPMTDDLSGKLNQVLGDQTETPKTCLYAIDVLARNLAGKEKELAQFADGRDTYNGMAELEKKKTENQLFEFDDRTSKIQAAASKRQDAADTRYNGLKDIDGALDRELEKVKNEAAAVNQQYQTETADANETVEEIADVNESLRARVENLTDPLFEVPDGKIVYVDQLNRVVRLNIGKADGVRLLTTFGVYPEDSIEQGNVVSKGALEVIRIVSDHESEARILNDEMQNPFTPGDLIYTPLWKMGEEVKVALDYHLDIDNDNKDDLDTLVNVIKATGSAVSAWIDKEGEIRGEISPDVTYMIVCNKPIMDVLEADHDLSDETKTKIQKAHMRLLKDAKDKDVRMITIAEFLRRTHYKQSAEVSRYQEPGGLNKNVDRTGVPIISRAAIAPIYDEQTKAAKVESFGITAPIYNPKRTESHGASSGKVSDAYFHRRGSNNL